VILNTCLTVRKFSAEQWVSNAWSVAPYCFENELNCCETRKVDDYDDDDKIVIIIIYLIVINFNRYAQFRGISLRL
jgi:hypothetical protein